MREQPTSYVGTLSGVAGDARIQRIGPVMFVDLRAEGGPAGFGSVTAPAEVAVGVVDALPGPGSAGTSLLVPADVRADGDLVPRLPAALAGRRAAALATSRRGAALPGDVVFTRMEVFRDTRGAPCRISLVLFGPRLDVLERSCAADRDKSLRFEGTLVASGRGRP